VIGSKIHVSYGTLQNGSNEINSSIPSLFLLIVRNRAGEKNRRCILVSSAFGKRIGVPQPKVKKKKK